MSEARESPHEFNGHQCRICDERMRCSAALSCEPESIEEKTCPLPEFLDGCRFCDAGARLPLFLPFAYIQTGGSGSAKYWHVCPQETVRVCGQQIVTTKALCMKWPTRGWLGQGSAILRRTKMTFSTRQGREWCPHCTARASEISAHYPVTDEALGRYSAAPLFDEEGRLRDTPIAQVRDFERADLPALGARDSLVLWRWDEGRYFDGGKYFLSVALHPENCASVFDAERLNRYEETFRQVKRLPLLTADIRRRLASSS